MNIRYSRETTVRFHKLEKGEIFSSSGDLFMRIYEISDHSPDIGDMIRNAIRLRDGQPWSFSPEVEVTPIDGQFVVK